MSSFPLPSRNFEDEIAEWHTIKFPNHDKWLCVAKLTEEVGELARAMIAEHEGRPDRGDVYQEAAQCAFVLNVLINRFYPGKHLLEGVQDELLRLTTNEEPNSLPSM